MTIVQEFSQSSTQQPHKINNRKKKWTMPVSTYQIIHGFKHVIWCNSWLKLDSMEQLVTSVHEYLKQGWTTCFYQWIPKQCQPIYIFDKLSSHNMASCCEKYQDFQFYFTPNAFMAYIINVISVDILDVWSAKKPCIAFHMHLGLETIYSTRRIWVS